MFNIKSRIKLLYLNKKLRKNNPDSFVQLLNLVDINKISVGKYTYGSLKIKMFGVDNEKLVIGSYCSIAEEVTFLLAGEHSYDRISTYPFKTKIKKEKEECFSNGSIIIGDDVWIGYGATILSGVTIGQGAIIGAGTTVAKDIPPYAIYANGKIQKYRFNENIIDKLKKINYNDLDKRTIDKNISLLYEKITENNIDVIIKELFDEK